MVIVNETNSIKINGDSYEKGTVRVAYSGDNISVFHPWHSNQALATDNFANCTLDGVAATSVEDFKDFERANFY